MKKVAYNLFAVPVLYYGSFLLLGPYTLAAKLGNDCNSSYNIYLWYDSVNIFCNYDFSDRQYIRISQAFRNPNMVVSIREMTDLDKYFSGEGHFNYILDFQSPRLSPYQAVFETEKIYQYGSSWKKTYLWFFGVWLKLDDQQIGIS
jgi:hypothetical protein